MFTELRRRAIGAFDALTAPHGVDRYVELVAPTWSSTEVRGRIVEARHSTPDSVTLTIRPNGNWHGFTAGQYTQLTVEIDGVRHTRCYSMANSALDRDVFELTIKAHPEGLVSRHLVANAAAGDVVGLTVPQGEFTLPTERPAHIVLISGGSGITPVMSMLRTLCAEGHTGPVTFVHYSLTEAGMIYRDELAAIAAAHPNVAVVRSFTDEPGRGDLDGFLTGEQLSTVSHDWAEAEAFVCGPAPLMAAATELYEQAGAAERCHTEAFTLPQFVAEAGAVAGSLRFGTADLEVANDGTPILLQAEAAGLTPESGCRMGICHTCTRSLTCGTVRDVVTGELTSGTNVDIRVCVSAPVGDVEIDL
jgi:stearoyl-CoA 9-desaturase NADPH oxidoreductase